MKIRARDAGLHTNRAPPRWMPEDLDVRTHLRAAWGVSTMSSLYLARLTPQQRSEPISQQHDAQRWSSIRLFEFELGLAQRLRHVRLVAEIGIDAALHEELANVLTAILMYRTTDPGEIARNFPATLV